VTGRPRASLGLVPDNLGTTLLELGHGEPGHDDGTEFGGIVIHDPVDEQR
jgi:hypothetical protein